MVNYCVLLISCFTEVIDVYWLLSDFPQDGEPQLDIRLISTRGSPYPRPELQITMTTFT